MGINRGPNLIKDNLVFGYDTGYGVADNSTATRFYPGKSVDNEFYNSGANGNILDHSSGYGGYGTVQTGVLDASGTTQNAVYRKTGKIRFGPTGGQDIGTLTNGNTYTFSIYLRHVAGQTESTSMEFDIVDQSSGGYNYTGTLGSNMTYEWKRFSVTSTHTNSSNYHFIDLGTYQGTNVFEWCMPQIESGTVASPFTSTERSSTQSLIDLKRTADIDLSNVSFDSTGQPTFDGTDDYVYINPISINVGSGMSFEAVYSAESSYTTWGTYHYLLRFVGSTHYGLLHEGDSRGWRIDVPSSTGTRTGTTTSSPNATAGAGYYHVAVSYDPVTGGKGYINGEQIGSWQGGYTAFTPTGLIIGAESTSNRFWNGDIPLVRVYSRSLSSQEVKQNYNAYKNRFDI